MQRHPLRTLAAFLLLALPLAACESPADPVPGGGDSITISGTLDNRSGAPLPDGARLVVVWHVVSGSPDYSVVHGEGTVSEESGTFSLTLDGPPPAEALNAGTIGVGLLVLTTDPDVGTGDRALDPGSIVGAAGGHAVIFRDGGEFESWPARFAEGYSVGVGVPGDDVFDAFEPADPGSVRLIVDDPAEIEFTNWS